MSTRKKLSLTAAGVALALSVVLASTATAAVVVSSRTCFRDAAPAGFLGTGFQPGQFVAVTLDGQRLATQPVAPTGVVGGAVRSLAPIPRSEMKRSLTMSQLSNPAIAATVVFTQTKVYVVTKPRRFRPGRRLGIRAGGFYGAGPTLYAHVRGRKRRNLRIGRIKGPCGKVSATRKVILKRGDPVGLYPTQFDTVRRYRGLAVPIGFRKTYFIRRVVRFSHGSSLSRSPFGQETWLSDSAPAD